MSRTTEAELTALAVRAGSGERAALENFIQVTQRDVWRFVAYLTDTESADDLTQETYLRTLRALPAFASRSSARTWLLAIARRVVVDHVRSLQSRPRRSSEVDWVRAAEEQHALRQGRTAGFEELVELRLLLAGLPADRLESLVLTQVLGMTYAEAAQICGCPVGTIRSRVARAREDLIRAGGEDYAARTAS